jgi:hypothetical protein
VKTLKCLLGIFAVALFSGGAEARAAEAERLNVCFSSIAATSITTWVPYETGIYKKYGLDVRIVYVAGAQAIATLVSGDTQIVQGSGAAAALSRLSGSDLTVIGTTINVIPMSLVTTPDILTAQDLKGKTYGVSRFGSLTDLGLKRAVAELGLDPEKDIKMIQTGGVPENLLFMQQGVIKGGLISSLEKAKELGYREFMNLANLKFRYPGTAGNDGFAHPQPPTDGQSFSQSNFGRHQIRQSQSGRHDSHSRQVHADHGYQAPHQRFQKLHPRLYPRCPHRDSCGNGSRYGRHRDKKSESQRRRCSPVLRPRATRAVGERRVYPGALSALNRRAAFKLF